jgi:hypothetical protein
MRVIKQLGITIPEAYIDYDDEGLDSITVIGLTKREAEYLDNIVRWNIRLARILRARVEIAKKEGRKHRVFQRQLDNLWSIERGYLINPEPKKDGVGYEVVPEDN